MSGLRSLHGVVGQAVLQRLLLGFDLQVVPLLQAAQQQAEQDVLAGLLDQLLKQPQGHDADLGRERGRCEHQTTPL